MSAKAVIRMPGEGKEVTLAGQPMTFLVTGDDTKHTSMFDWTLPAGFSTGRHVHRIQEETMPIRLLAKAMIRSKFPAWTLVASRRHSPNFSGSLPMTRPAQDTLNTCDGRTGLRVSSAGMLASRTASLSERRWFCDAVLALPMFRLRPAPS